MLILLHSLSMIGLELCVHLKGYGAGLAHAKRRCPPNTSPKIDPPARSPRSPPGRPQFPSLSSDDHVQLAWSSVRPGRST